MKKAASSAAEAVAASPATITCIASHDQTIALLEGFAESLAGKTIIELKNPKSGNLRISVKFDPPR